MDVLSQHSCQVSGLTDCLFGSCYCMSACYGGVARNMFARLANMLLNVVPIGIILHYHIILPFTPPLSKPLAPDNCLQIHMWRVRGFPLGSPPEER